MKINVFENPEKFLSIVQAELEKQEVVNGLILGVVQRLVDEPEQIKHAPYLAFIEDDSGKIMLIAMMTPPFALTLAANGDCPEEALLLLADALLTKEWAVPSVHGPNPIPERFVDIWTKKVGKDFELEMGQGVYELREVIPPKNVAGGLVQAGLSDLALISNWMMAFNLDAFGEEQGSLADMIEGMAYRIKSGACYFWMVDGEPFSFVLKSRSTRHSISVGGVYTPPALRGNGYASACVAAFSQKLLDEGYEFTSLFTDLANPTSNKIYINIGYVHVCDFNKFKFIEK